MTLDGKIALITGAASGIGRASAVILAEQGASLILSDVNVEGGEDTADRVIKGGGQAIFTRCDVSKSADVEAMVKMGVEKFGGLDIAVNNAGIARLQTPIDKIEEDQWDAIMNINLKGVWLCMKYEIPAMLERGGGSIINVASLAGLVGTPYGSDYGASKHGVIGLTKSAALEYVRQGIRVNAVCPGFIDTPMVEAVIEQNPKMDAMTRKWSPMRRRGTVDEIANAVLYLAGDTSSFVNGHTLTVDGGAAAQ